MQLRRAHGGEKHRAGGSGRAPESSAQPRAAGQLGSPSGTLQRSAGAAPWLKKSSARA